MNVWTSRKQAARHRGKIQICAGQKRLLGYILEHKDEMAEAPGHDKKVKDFMGAEVLVPRVEQRKLEGVDHAADRVEEPSRQKPEESGQRQRVP